MPYATNAQLPTPLRKALPRLAQDIHLAAFNDAAERYGELSASRIAWAAVKRQYIRRAAGIWIRRARPA